MASPSPSLSYIAMQPCIATLRHHALRCVAVHRHASVVSPRATSGRPRGGRPLVGHGARHPATRACGWPRPLLWSCGFRSWRVRSVALWRGAGEFCAGGEGGRAGGLVCLIHTCPGNRAYFARIREFAYSHAPPHASTHKQVFTYLKHPSCSSLRARSTEDSSNWTLGFFSLLFRVLVCLFWSDLKF